MGYSIQSIPASSRTYTRGREGCSIGHIVVHYTGAAGGAVDNGRYFAGGARGASAHYFVDSTAIVQSVADSDTAWAVGNWQANLRTLSIEVCSAGEDYTQGERERLRWLVRTLMARHGIDAAHVIRHYDVYDAYRNIGGRWIDPHKCCPAPYAPNGGDPSGAKWRELHAYITSEEEDMTDDQAQMLRAIYDVLVPYMGWQYSNEGTGDECDMHQMQVDMWGVLHKYMGWQYRKVDDGDGVSDPVDMHQMMVDTWTGIPKLLAMEAAQTEAIKALAKMQGADPDAVAKAVSDAVEAKLRTIRLEVSTDAKEG